MEDTLEVLRCMAEIHRTQFDQRRRLEHRVFFTTASFYVAASGAALTGQISLSRELAWVACGAYLFIAATTSVFLVYIVMANNKNKTIAENAEKAMMQIIKKETPDLEIYQFDSAWTSWSTWRRPGRWGWFWESVMLTALAATAATVLLDQLG